MEQVTRERRRTVSLLVRHPCLTVFVVALLARAAVAGLLRWRYDGVLFGDEATYSTLAAQAATDMTAGWDAYTAQLYAASASFVYPLRALYEVFGVEILAGQLLVALFGALTAALTTRLALFALPVRSAMAAGLAVALLPSQVLWSSLTLKDALSWLLLAGTAALVALAARAERAPSSIALLMGAAGALLLMSRVREHTLVVACIALALTAWVGRPEHRLSRAATGVAIAVLLPWLAGAGLLGIELITSRAGTLEMQRAAGAAGAATALVDPSNGTSAAPRGTSGRPGVSGGADGRPGQDAPADAPDEPPGAPEAGGAGRDPFGGISDGAGAANLAYLPRGLAVMLFAPYPWEPSPSRAVDVAKLEMLLWYPLLLLAAVGIPSVRRHATALLFPLVVGAGTATMWALVEGNFGTAYRHRGEFVWVVALAAAFGAAQVARWWRAARQADAEPGGSGECFPSAAASPGRREAVVAHESNYAEALQGIRPDPR